MSARYDKYDPINGGFRAILNAALTFDANGSSGIVAVSLNASGKVVVGTAGQSGFVGVVVKNVPMTPNLGNIAGQVNSAVPIGGVAGEVVDIMTDGEIVYNVADLLVTGGIAFVAGKRYYAKADGTISPTLADGPYIGHTVEATRLVVRKVSI